MRDRPGFPFGLLVIAWILAGAFIREGPNGQERFHAFLFGSLLAALFIIIAAWLVGLALEARRGRSTDDGKD